MIWPMLNTEESSTLASALLPWSGTVKSEVSIVLADAPSAPSAPASPFVPLGPGTDVAKQTLVGSDIRKSFQMRELVRILRSR
jgi:hypothetical protein